MRLCDTLQLTKNEFRYGKIEWIISIILQILIFSCALFVFSLAMDMDRIGDAYLHKMHPGGYEFSFQGYTENDREELENMGFYNLSLDGDGGIGITDEIKGLWLKKIKAVIEGKDIWNPEIDEFVVVIGLFQAIFLIIAILLIVVMLNNIANSYSMKLMRREYYIKMLSGLGCRKQEIKRIYYIFFSTRNLISLFASWGINVGLAVLFNRYIAELLGITSGMKILRIAEGISLIFLVELMMKIIFTKVWRESNVDNG